MQHVNSNSCSSGSLLAPGDLPAFWAEMREVRETFMAIPLDRDMLKDYIYTVAFSEPISKLSSLSIWKVLARRMLVILRRKPGFRALAASLQETGWRGGLPKVLGTLALMREACHTLDQQLTLFTQGNEIEYLRKMFEPLGGGANLKAFHFPECNRQLLSSRTEAERRAYLAFPRHLKLLSDPMIFPAVVSHLLLQGAETTLEGAGVEIDLQSTWYLETLKDYLKQQGPSVSGSCRKRASFTGRQVDELLQDLARWNGIQFEIEMTRFNMEDIYGVFS